MALKLALPKGDRTGHAPCERALEIGPAMASSQVVSRRPRDPLSGALMKVLAVLSFFFAACTLSDAHGGSGRTDDGPQGASHADMTSPLTEPSAPTEPAAQAAAVRIPQDEGIHLDALEWWYFNGHLDTPDGRTFNYHFTTFQVMPGPGVMTRVTQLGWGDHARSLHFVEERAEFPPWDATSGRFDLVTGGWRMSGDAETYRLSFSIGGYAVELEAVPSKPVVLHNKTGLLDMGEAGKTYYYSHTDMKTSGTVTIDGISHPIAGKTWYDHQWFGATSTEVGWDWLSLNLSDGSDLMLSFLWELEGREPVVSFATYVPADASAPAHLTGAEISMKPTGTWTSDDTGAEYPMGWEVAVPSLGFELAVTPVIKEAEFSTSAFIPVVYWEGAVAATGARGGTPVSGRGYMEMVGYASSQLDGLFTRTAEPDGVFTPHDQPNP